MKFQTDNYDGLKLTGLIVVDTKAAENLLQETICLSEMVGAFSQEMRDKILKYLMKGRKGWENPEMCPNSRIYVSLRKALAEQDYVSVANYAMLLWNREQQGG